MPYGIRSRRENCEVGQIKLTKANNLKNGGTKNKNGYRDGNQNKRIENL